MKKPSFPTWTAIAICIISFFFLVFYLNGKLALNFSWNDDLGKVFLFMLTFFFISLNVGIEWARIAAYVKFTKKVGKDEHHRLYEYLQDYLARYNMEEKPSMDFLKKVFLIRLVHLNCKRPIETITNEVCQLCSVDEKERTIQLNMLIDHWIEEFIKEAEEKRKNENYRIKSTERPIEVSDDMQFHVMSFLLTNVCHETINVESGRKIKNDA